MCAFVCCVHMDRQLFTCCGGGWQHPVPSLVCVEFAHPHSHSGPPRVLTCRLRLSVCAASASQSAIDCIDTWPEHHHVRASPLRLRAKHLFVACRHFLGPLPVCRTALQASLAAAHKRFTTRGTTCLSGTSAPLSGDLLSVPPTMCDVCVQCSAVWPVLPWGQPDATLLCLRVVCGLYARMMSG